MCLFGQFGNFLGEDPPRRAAWTRENETKIIMGETKGRGAQKDPTGWLWTSQGVLKMPKVSPRGPKAKGTPWPPRGAEGAPRAPRAPKAPLGPPGPRRGPGLGPGSHNCWAPGSPGSLGSRGAARRRS